LEAENSVQQANRSRRCTELRCTSVACLFASPLVEGERTKVRDQFTVCVAFQSSLTLPLSLF